MKIKGLFFNARKRLSYIPQMEVTECGAACLAMILAYHGCHSTLAEVREICKVSRDGTNALAIVHAAREYGLVAKGMRMELDDLHSLSFPVILYWDFNHFVVLEKTGKKTLTILDPAAGRRTCTYSDAGKHFTGAVLHFTPGETFVKKVKKSLRLTRYKEMVSEVSPALIQVVLASLCLQVISLVFPVANQLLLDKVVLPSHDAWLLGIATGMGGAVIIRALLSLVRNYVIQNIRIILDVKLMSGFLDHLLHLPLSFFAVRETGDLIQRVQSNATLRNLFSTQVVSVVLDSLLLIGYAVLMILYNPLLGSVVLLTALLRVGVFLKFRQNNQQIMTTELSAAGRESGALVEALSGMETIKASGAELRMIQRFVNRMIQRVRASIDREMLRLNAGQLTIIIEGCTIASIFLIGGHEVLKYRMTIGVFSSFLILKELFITPLGTFVSTLGQLQFLGNHLQRLDDVLDTPKEETGTTDLGRITGKIDVNNVTFSYSPGSKPVLKNITISIKPGQKVAIAGPSGAGKSTLARLLLGMYQVESGTVYFDDVDLKNVTIQKLRNQTGIVLQETFLFDDTVRANLCLNNEHLSFKQLQWAAQIAAIDEVIERLPQGYDSRIGENGSRLSGGERQRLTIARAIVHNPAVLLMDEATSSLDVTTEKVVHDNLAQLNCTRILIAHRLETVKDADLIVVLNEGEIVQTGTFAELKDSDGLFASLLKSSYFKIEPESIYE